MKHHLRYAFVPALLCLMQASPSFAQTPPPLPWQTAGQPGQQSPQDNSLHTISGVPLFIDGTQTKTVPAALSPALLDQVKTVTTLGDALRILGPAYVAPNDDLHIAHWHFQNNTMLTLWPQGGEALTDAVSVSPRPDCGVAPSDCKDLVLNRKQGSQHKRGSSGGSGGSSSGGSSLLSPLMKMIPGR